MRALLVVAPLLVVPTLAQASDQLGERASVAIVADNLFGVTRTSNDDAHGDAVTDIGTQISGLGGTRLGVHGFASKYLSLGVGLHFFGDRHSVMIGAAPRIGVIVPIADGSALWLRAGFGYQYWSYHGDETESRVTVGAEVQYVATLTSHFGWTFGPTIEKDLSASQTVVTRTYEPPKRTALGVGVGLLFDF